MAKIRAVLESLSAEVQRRVVRWANEVFGAPLDPTGADRMQRYRDRHVTVLRDGVTSRVTESPMVSPQDPPSLHVYGSDLASTKDRNNGLKADALTVLNFLNAKANRSFRPVETTLRPIIARLGSGVSVSECKGVIIRKAREWENDPKMRAFLRPETLFNATKFESYLGEKPPPESEE